MPKLIISGVTHELVDEAITIGRGPDNTIVVNDPSISTHHVQLLLEGDTYRLKDLDSTNGTRVNGKPVTETVLRFDDRIRFGAAEARYESSEVGGSKPLPKPEEIKAHFAEAGAELPHLSSASPLRRQEQQNDPVRTGILIGLGIVLLVFLGSIIAVLMMHAPCTLTGCPQESDRWSKNHEARMSNDEPRQTIQLFVKGFSFIRLRIRHSDFVIARIQSACCFSTLTAR